ncbi:sensor histidine kinase [Halorarum salinum]|uniref:histidine kinase n=1 Tax=Halorarum salinum TaxID=2743089 RepID=A0A7D5QGH0_9EURY|nr:HAMP domain-containing sensor histidine kinase [Halobaculum salinum]QLG62223.1 HAMP domain-containing histidine kinase [Halobaculum salinum]
MTNAFGTASRRELWPASGFYMLGSTGLGLSVVHLLTEGTRFGTVLEAIIIASLSCVIIYSGYDLTTRDISDSGSRHALIKTCLSIFAFALLGLAITSIQFVQHPAFPESQFMVLFGGVLGGAYGGQANLCVVESEEESEHVRELTKLLNVNQRVLRHNLRNELAIALGHLENVEAKLGSDNPDVRRVKDHLEELLNLSESSRRIVSIWEDDTIQKFPVRKLVDERVQRFRRDHPEVPVSTEIPEGYTIRGHSALPRAIDEALENAVIHNDGEVEIAIECSSPVQTEQVRLSIADTGSGLPLDEVNALFQPTETQLSHGEGLGLWVIYWTVMRSGGELDFRENDPQGAVVELRLPATMAR